MTQIDFHVLPEANDEARLLYACRFIEKVFGMGHSIVILVDSIESAQQLDDLLWSFKPESFIPHHIIHTDTKTETDDEKVPVEISFDENNLGLHRDVLINLHQNIPADFNRFARVCEIVIQQENILQATRAHHQFYKAQGLQPQTHKR